MCHSSIRHYAVTGGEQQIFSPQLQQSALHFSVGLDAQRIRAQREVARSRLISEKPAQSAGIVELGILKRPSVQILSTKKK